MAKVYYKYMKYSFSCPIEGCTWTTTVEAENRNEALDKLSEQAGEHVTQVHSDLQKTPEQVRLDVSSIMVEGEPAQPNPS